MGMTIEFYSAQPHALVALFESESDDFFDEQIQKYPVADFSLHLLIPDDLDSFCQALRACGIAVPATFHDLLVAQVWVDDPQVPSASLTLVQETLAKAFSQLTDKDIAEANRKWAASFPDLDSDTLKQEVEQNTAQALFSLRTVAQDVIAQGTSLLLFLSGHVNW